VFPARGSVGGADLRFLEPVVTAGAVALPCLPAPYVPSVYRWLRSRPVADASGAPVLGDQRPIGWPVTARPIQASSRTAGFLSVTCDPGTAHTNLYIHRRCSSRGSRRSRIRAALQETVAAAGGDASPDLPAGRDFRMGEGFPAVTFMSRQAGNPSPHIGIGGLQGECPCPESVP
jgi:hypothetical protein